MKYELDCQGLKCPEPLTLIRIKLKELSIGDTLIVLSDDKVSLRDIPNYCEFMNHKLISTSTDNDICYTYTIEKMY